MKVFAGLPVVANFDDMAGSFDAVVVTDLHSAKESFDLAAAVVGAERVLSPKLLGLRTRYGEAE